MTAHTVEQIVVLGSGNWGLALAALFADRLPVRVWAIDEEMARRVNAERDGPSRFSRVAIPESIVVEAKYASDLDEATTLVIMAVPSGQVGAVSRELAAAAASPLVLSVSKGFDAGNQCTMSELIRREIPGATVVVLSGPTIAGEVAERKPTRAVLAGDDLMHLAVVKEALTNDVMSFEVSRDPTHHEICAALKGLVAMAVGMADGLDLGANAQGILMTEGIREMSKVASFFGMPPAVAYGISGAGDLIATCIAPDSRNRRLGAYLAEGMTLQQALDAVGMTVEGVAMSQTIETLWSLDVSIPLVHFVNAAIRGEFEDVGSEMADLFRRL